MEMTEELETYEETPSYCIELKEMWDQFNSQIKWENSSYSKGWVRMGDINLARISFWQESPYSGYNKIGRDPPLTEKKIEWSKLVDNHYSGQYITIYNLRTGDILIGANRGWSFKIDFGKDAYLHKESWTWANNEVVDVGDLIKKAARAWGFIEAWCL